MMQACGRGEPHATGAPGLWGRGQPGQEKGGTPTDGHFRRLGLKKRKNDDFIFSEHRTKMSFGGRYLTLYL